MLLVVFGIFVGVCFYELTVWVQVGFTRYRFIHNVPAHTVGIVAASLAMLINMQFNHRLEIVNLKTTYDAQLVELNKGNNRRMIKAKLQEFYTELTELWHMDVKEKDLKKYYKKLDDRTDVMADWIKQNMGVAAKDKFEDMVGVNHVFKFDKKLNDEHNEVLLNLQRIRENLEYLIETDKWN